MIKKKKLLAYYGLPILVILVTGLLMLTGTFAKYVYTTATTDSAAVAMFDIEVLTPYELSNISPENPYHHSFSEKWQSQIFDFAVTNNREVNVICSPYFDKNIPFMILIEDEQYESFIIETGETVYFQVVILADGLLAEEVATNLILDIEQI
jgi:hypothetical protein